MTIPNKILIIITLHLLSLSSGFSQDETKLFRDSLDGAFDVSKWLLDLHGFLPIAAPITEPALGYGAAVAGGYFIPKEKTNKAEFKMPDIVGAAGGYTQNGTWFAGAGYMGFWKDDQVRYRGVLGYGSINLKYYGLGGGYLETDPAEFNIESLFFLQQALFRINKSNFLLGGKYLFGKTKVTSFEESKRPNVDERDFDLTNSGLGIVAEFETQNNILSPTKGIRMNLSYSQFLEFLGSDKSNGRLSFFTHYYIPLLQSWVSGFRLESNLATSGTPFYMMPFVSLRGVPVLRYQGELTALAETEQLFRVYKRWSVVAFTGFGKTWNFSGETTAGPTVWNAGGGFRYLIARMMKLQMGIDIARGPEDWAFYIVFGSAWLK